MDLVQMTYNSKALSDGLGHMCPSDKISADEHPKFQTAQAGWNSESSISIDDTGS
jgi:hypothetical protein